jgi:hypothetical protein
MSSTHRAASASAIWLLEQQPAEPSDCRTFEAGLTLLGVQDDELERLVERHNTWLISRAASSALMRVRRSIARESRCRRALGRHEHMFS